MIAPGPDNRYFRWIRGLTVVWVFTLVLALYPYTEDPAAPIKVLVSAVAALVLCAIWAVGAARGQLPVRPPNAALLLMLVFLAAQLVAALLSETPARGYAATLPRCVFALLAFVIHQAFPEPRHLRLLFRAIVAATALSSLYGLAQHWGLDPFPWSDRSVEEYRGLPATFGNPNLAGHTIVIAIVLCAGLVADAWRRRRRVSALALYGVAGALLLWHLYASGMRGGLAALTMAGLFAAIYVFMSARGVASARAGLGALSGAVLALFLAAVAAVVLAPRLSLDSALQLRLHGYRGAAAIFLDHPWTGVGPGGYAIHAVGRWTEFESLWYALENRRNFHAHNEWLEAAAESGLPGLAALIALFLAAVAGAFAHPRFGAARERALLVAAPASVVAVAVDACTGFNLHAPASAALFFVLAVQHGGPSGGALRGGRRVLPPLAILLALALAFGAWRQFQAETLQQRARGAIAWERKQRAAGHVDAAEQSARAASAYLAGAARHTPWDFRTSMLAGDAALARGHVEAALAAYERALTLFPDLPRLHVQYARAHIRLAARRNGADRAEALQTAEQAARTALERVPALAEAWEMIGWIAYRRAEDSRVAEEWRAAAAAFEHARMLGASTDVNVNAALASAYAQLTAWEQAADAGARAVAQAPGIPAYWDRFRDAASRAGGGWPARYRQALIHQLAGAESDTEAASIWAARIAEAPFEPGVLDVPRAVLEEVLERNPEQLALWGAWLTLVEEGGRASALPAMAARIPGGHAPEVIGRMAAALAGSELAPLAEASAALLKTLATVPGGARMGADASVYQSLVRTLEGRVRAMALPDARLAPVLADLGGAWFEAGAPGQAERLLSEAASHLPPHASGALLYDRARALEALDQPDAALALAREAARLPDAPLAHRWQLARALANSGETEAAAFLFESLARSLPADHPYAAPLASARAALDRGAGGAP
ncbi:MAG: O-antigen ligase family protein [Candidatus Hydrogenedentes bacterium]|nr:O-antigen ligase family protein [Candidatus Hydrogenedentota bacterium]